MEFAAADAIGLTVNFYHGLLTTIADLAALAALALGVNVSVWSAPIGSVAVATGLLAVPISLVAVSISSVAVAVAGNILFGH